MSIIRADSIKDRSGNGAPTAPNGFQVTGVCTATSFVGSGTALTGIDAATLKFGNDTKAQAVAGGVNITGALGVSGVLTYEDVTNVDSIGVITARDGLRVTGIATATAFHGDGSALTGIDASSLSSGGSVIVQASASAVTVTAGKHLNPATTNTTDLGTSSLRWRNLYTQDLQLSNESSGGNNVDGTWGNWTLQELSLIHI